MDDANLYDILGVRQDAPQEAIKAAYREKARKTHPDHGGSQEAFVTVSQAYKILSDPEQRKEYDRTGRIPNEFDIPREAMSLLVSFFISYVDRIDFDNVSRIDPFEKIKEALGKELRKPEALIEAVKKQRQKIKLIRKRMKYRKRKKAPDNFLKRVLLDMEGKLDRQEKMAKRTEKIILLAGEILEAYSFNTEEGEGLEGLFHRLQFSGSFTTTDSSNTFGATGGPF